MIELAILSGLAFGLFVMSLLGIFIHYNNVANGRK
jgi:hypothetical protein